MRLIIPTLLIVLITLASCIEPVPDIDDPDRLSDPSVPVVVAVSASAHDGNVPENILDGDLSTRWSARGEGQFVEFEFDGVVRVESLGIAWYLGDERYSTFEVLTSVDGVDWVSRVSRTTDVLTRDYQVDDLGVDARFVRIVGFGNSDSSWNSITGIQVNGEVPLFEPRESSEEPEEPIDDPGDDPVAPSERTVSLRGDPDFSIDQLPASQRANYERFLAEINDPDNRRGVEELIDRDDAFFYGRTFQGHIQSVLTVFRYTGDLRLLDHVDELIERMRENLDYGWRDTRDGTDGEWDEYLMWVYRTSSSSGSNTANDGKDRKIDDVKVNALIAMVAFALEENRDLESPSGRDYGAHADYWQYYLVDHFEAKWRDRSNKPSGHPITTPHSDSHSWWSWTKLSYYMGELGDPGWAAEAVRAADVIWDHEIRDVADYGEDFSAYVWMSNIAWQSSSRNYLQSSSYASSNYGDAVTFHLEGFHKWAAEDRMRSFARGITEYQFRLRDGSRYSSPSDITAGIAGDIGGNSPDYKVVRAGIPPDDRDERPIRRTSRVFAGHQTSLLAAWDDSGMIVAVGEAVEVDRPDTDMTKVLAGRFVSSWYEE